MNRIELCLRHIQACQNAEFRGREPIDTHHLLVAWLLVLANVRGTLTDAIANANSALFMFDGLLLFVMTKPRQGFTFHSGSPAANRTNTPTPPLDVNTHQRRRNRC